MYVEGMRNFRNSLHEDDVECVAYNAVYFKYGCSGNKGRGTIGGREGVNGGEEVWVRI